MIRTTLISFLIFYSGCKSQSKPDNDTPEDAVPPKSPIESNFSRYGNYFKLIKKNDSTSQLAWGNDTVSRVFESEIDSPTAERIHYEWESKDYLILKYGVGSGAWMNLVLPLNKEERTLEFSNALYFDSINNLIAVQQNLDTILAVENLKTGHRQYIIEKDHLCESASNLYCLDSIQFQKGILSFNWITPSKFDKKQKLYKKKIKIVI